MYKTWEECDHFFRDNLSLFENYNGEKVVYDEFMASYCLARLLMLGENHLDFPELFQKFQSHLEKIQTPSNDYSLWAQLVPFLVEDGSRLALALALCRDPNLQTYFSKLPKSCPNFQKNSPQSLAEVIALHPSTKDLQKKLDKIAELKTQYPKEIFELFNAFNKTLIPEKIEQVYSFSQALELTHVDQKIKAFYTAYQELLKNANYVPQAATHWGISPSNIFYNFIYNQLPTAADFWDNLGLKTEYQSEFKSEKEFWSCEESLLSIYTKLSHQKLNVMIQDINVKNIRLE